MTANRALNIVLSIAVLAAWMATAAHFDKERFDGDMRHDSDTQVQQRKQAAALKICGPGAAANWVDNTTLDCSMHTLLEQPTITGAGL